MTPVFFVGSILKNTGTQCVQSQWRFVPQYDEIYEHNLRVSRHCWAVPSPFHAANVTCLRQSKESTYSVIVKLGKEQRDIMDCVQSK